VYNKESDKSSIWSTCIVDWNTDILDFWITRLEIVTHLSFLTHFLFIIMGCNLEYEWGNVKGLVTCGNY
jgi:hypothetical protein